jgi:hypothetical protein
MLPIVIPTPAIMILIMSKTIPPIIFPAAIVYVIEEKVVLFL